MSWFTLCYANNKETNQVDQQLEMRWKQYGITWLLISTRATSSCVIKETGNNVEMEASVSVEMGIIISQRQTLYNWCILLRLKSGFVNSRKWCSPRQTSKECINNCFVIWLFYSFLYPVSVTFLLEVQCLKKSAGFTKGIFTYLN